MEIFEQLIILFFFMNISKKPKQSFNAAVNTLKYMYAKSPSFFLYKLITCIY